MLFLLFLSYFSIFIDYFIILDQLSFIRYFLYFFISSSFPAFILSFFTF